MTHNHVPNLVASVLSKIRISLNAPICEGVFCVFWGFIINGYWDFLNPKSHQYDKTLTHNKTYSFLLSLLMKHWIFMKKTDLSMFFSTIKYMFLHIRYGALSLHFFSIQGVKFKWFSKMIKNKKSSISIFYPWVLA